jgi:hypothetical protein
MRSRSGSTASWNKLKRVLEKKLSLGIWAEEVAHGGSSFGKELQVVVLGEAPLQGPMVEMEIE